MNLRSNLLVVPSLRLVVAYFIVFSAAFADAPANSPRLSCAELLNGESRASETVHRIGPESINVEALVWGRITDLRSQVEQTKTPGIVVYAVAPLKQGVSVLRFESTGRKKDSLEEVVSRSNMEDASFRRAVNASGRKGGDYHRSVLRDELKIPFRERDSGKTVFLADLGAFGLVPEALAFPEATLAVSPNLDRAVANRASLLNDRNASARYTGLFGIPNTEGEYAQIFDARSGQSKYPPLESWQPHSVEAQAIAQRYSLSLLTGGQDRPTKASIMRQLETQDGIIMIVAHADGAHIRLAGGEIIALSPKDIAGLKLSKAPFVFLRVCQGEDIGFADAFVKAGAKGVWANRGVINAGVANRQAELFLQQVRANKTIFEAVEAVKAQDTDAMYGSALFTRLMFSTQEGFKSIWRH